MAREIPTKYDDPFWTGLAANTEKKLDLPSGLLVSVLTNGEKTNADRVSPAGAKTPFQIIPQTRSGAMKNYGIDPYLSPENAAEVAGLLLKDSLKRNRGDVEQAVGEYHGGLDRKAWGPVNEAYRKRVMGGMGAEPTGQPQSTYERLKQANEARTSGGSVSSVYSAYTSGKMTPEDSATFEDAVKNGQIMLPRGSALKSAPAPKQGGNMAPQSVADAYASGTMEPQDRAQLEGWIKDGTVTLPPSSVSKIPTEPGANLVPTGPGPEPTLGERAIGTGEAALSAITGMTGGALGMAGGLPVGLIKAAAKGQLGTPEGANLVEQTMAEGAGALTYQPRTPQGQQQVQAVGNALAQALPVMPLTGELQLLGRAGATAGPSIGAARQIGTQAAKAGGQAVAAGAKQAGQAIAALPGRAAEAVGLREPAAAPRQAGGSGGAAGASLETVRDLQAAGLPVPVELTRGAARRDAGQLAFEKEQMKSAEFGEPLRARAEANSDQIMSNFDAFVDEVGPTAFEPSDVGRSVTNALAANAAKDKAAIRVAFKNADKAGETAAPVNLDTLVAHLEQSAPEAATAPLLTTAIALAKKLKIAEEVNGQLVPLPNVPIKTAELFRQAINRNTGFEPTNIRQSSIIKQLIDESTAGQGGDIYRGARRLRENFAKRYENRAIIADLINNRKGMSDPRVAIDKVFNRTVLNGSPEELLFLRRSLKSSGPDGVQAWKDLQGAAIKHIKESSTALSKDSLGRDMVSVAKLNQAVTALEKNGRLEILFGKKGAELMRTLNEVAGYVNTVPPGTLINTSGTAATLMAAIAEAGLTGATTGIPLPIISGLRQISASIKNVKLRRRIQDTLKAPENLQGNP